MKKLFFFLYLGVLFSVIFLYFCLSALPDGKLHVFVLDIGQGDSILIQTPTAEHILIDGGPDDKVIEQLGHTLPFYERTIDLVIVSHPHADHINGLVEVLKRYQVGKILMTGANYKNPGYTAFLQQAIEQKIPILYAGDEHDYQLGTVLLDMLFPFESLQGQSFENLNNSSITFRLLYGQRKFYFSGDLEVEGEEKLVASKLDLSADLLKAPHHGSRTSSSEPLLDLMKPSYALISCGVNNKFKHPYPGTIQHFQERHITTYRTDLDGTIEAISDGDKITVRTFGK